jgi:regulator of RNase E activity RraA
MAPISPTQPVCDRVLEQLARFDSCTVCNVIELCSIRPRNTGYLDASIRAVYPELPPMVGYAVTATFRSAAPLPPDETGYNLAQQIASWEQVPEPRILVIQDLDDRPMGAVYGEVVASTAKAFGCVGLVTNGYARDILQVRALDFPCFATGVCVSHAYCRFTSMSTPLTVGGVFIQPGDLLHGDANGVTTIPHELAECIAQACPELVENENILIEAAREPGLTRERFGELAQLFAQKQAQLAAKLIRKRA